jgi:hypothetical protein
MLLEAHPNPRVFLLSPANASGERAKMVLKDTAKFDLAGNVRHGTATLGQVFSFVSGLYFRGKIAYSEAFALPPRDVPPSYVIAPGRGLVPPDTCVGLGDLREMAGVPVDGSNAKYREPLVRDARALAARIGPASDVILLGSVASPKYIEPLLDVFGERLLFPEDFVGRGDMSRGGLMLRCARSGVELTYIPVRGAVRHGRRPPRLPKLPRDANSG